MVLFLALYATIIYYLIMYNFISVLYGVIIVTVYHYDLGTIWQYIGSL